MLIIGCDYHPGFQQIAFIDNETGECGGRRLEHVGDAEQFYRDLRARGMEARIGLEASGYTRWFERLVAELGFELWVGDAAAISSKRVRKHKTDKQDAELLLTLLMENRFPRIWIPSREERDLRQLLWHRHRLVQTQTRLRNQLHAVALNEGVRLKKRMWRPKGRAQLESLPLAPWASRRRQDLLRMLDQVDTTILDLTAAIEQEAQKRPEVVRLMTHPGVGALTALAFVSSALPSASPGVSSSATIWGWCRLRSPAENAGTWDTSANKETRCCASCWWRQRKSRCAVIPTGAADICTWRCAANVPSQRSPWRGCWPSACTGCGGTGGITRIFRSLVRTRDSPEIALVCGKRPR